MEKGMSENNSVLSELKLEHVVLICYPFRGSALDRQKSESKRSRWVLLLINSMMGNTVFH